MCSKILSSLNPQIPSQKTIEARFKFIKDDLLGTNITISFRYILFLIILEEDKVKLPGPISYSIFKDIIVHTAAIVESCIYYCLKTAIFLNKIEEKDIMDIEWKEITCKDLYKISGVEKVCGVIKRKQCESFEDSTQFITLNKAAFRAKVFDKEEYDCAEKIRKIRNRIHLAALKETDDFYQKKDVNNVFDNAKKIIDKIEKYLN